MYASFATKMLYYDQMVVFKSLLIKRIHIDWYDPESLVTKETIKIKRIHFECRKLPSQSTYVYLFYDKNWILSRKLVKIDGKKGLIYTNQVDQIWQMFAYV
jgi:hypothetical protein